MTNGAQPPSETQWRKCKPGELLQLSVQQKQLRQRRAVLRGIGVVAAGVAAASLGVVWFQRSEQSSAPGNIACDAVRPLLPAYLAHQLDAELTSQIEQHLAHCEHCSQALQKLKSATGMMQTISSPSKCERSQLEQRELSSSLQRQSFVAVVHKEGLANPS